VYLDYRDPLFRPWATSASGPGIHTDEASSAIAAIADTGATTLAATLARAVDAGEGVRRNPRGKEPRRRNPKKAKTVMAPHVELFECAALTTGMWGPEPPTIDRVVSVGRRLPVIRNPAAITRIYVPFAARMKMLSAAISGLLSRVETRAGEGEGRAWKFQLNKCLAAVDYVVKDMDKPDAGVFRKDDKGKLLVLGLKSGSWSILAAQGNKKLPFVAYSELPMATCPGAGACRVTYDRSYVGWCYSFTSFRNPAAFARMFLNTLCNYYDRELAIMSAGGPSDPREYEARVQAAVRGHERRTWMQFVKTLALALTADGRAKGKTSFMRLFVDGDVAYEDCIVEWMQICREMDHGVADPPSMGHVEVYGYTKCWQQFVNVDGYLGGDWPKNYTVNLSSGSVYAAEKSERLSPIREAMEKLPVSRGYFEAIPLNKGYIKELEAQAQAFRQDPNKVVPMPAAGTTPFAFDATRIRDFTRIGAFETADEAMAAMPGLVLPRRSKAEKVRHKAYQYYLQTLLRDPRFGAVVRRELKRDEDPTNEAAYLDAYEAKQRERLALIASGGAADGEEFDVERLRNKALALALHEALWTFGLGGSCPLVCGNCSDHPTDPTQGVHRCASKGAFRGAKIHIGLH